MGFMDKFKGFRAKLQAKRGGGGTPVMGGPGKKRFGGLLGKMFSKFKGGGGPFSNMKSKMQKMSGNMPNTGNQFPKKLGIFGGGFGGGGFGKGLGSRLRQMMMRRRQKVTGQQQAPPQQQAPQNPDMTSGGGY
tara:strand:- start:9278 stop:9676 length:399 start_codon:yes stop_codon:yes gene_type:complete